MLADFIEADFIEVKEAAKELNMGLSTLYKHLALARIKPRRFGKAAYVRRKALMDWLDAA